jgi:hypothetical protein
MDMDNNLSLDGEYRFYEDGKEIYRSKNILTKFGKRYITQYLAGQASTNSKDIAVGIGSNAASENNTSLNFEFYRAQVNLSSVDIQTSPTTGLSTYGVVYKTTLPVDVSGIVSEIGLFPSITLGATDYASKSISNFSDYQQWKNDDDSYSTVVTTPTPRIGSNHLSLTATASNRKQYSSNVEIDVSGYSPNDSLTVAYVQSDLNLDYVFVKLYSSSTDYYEIRYPGDVAIGNKINSLTLNNLYSSGFGLGTPDNSSIIKVSIGAKAKSSGSTNVLFDGLRINDEDSFRSDYGLISRSVLTNPITKSIGRQMDIEYRLGLTF